MRNYLLLLTFFSISCFGQRDIVERQKHQFETANKSLSEKRSLSEILICYKSAYLVDTESEIGKICLAKHDSIRPILRNQLMKKIIGKWKLESIGSNWGMESKSDEIIVITENSISFYKYDDKSKTTTLSRNQKIIYSNTIALMVGYSELVFDDKTLWAFFLNSDGNLNLENTGEITTEGIMHSVCGNTEMVYKRLE